MSAVSHWPDVCGLDLARCNRPQPEEETAGHRPGSHSVADHDHVEVVVDHAKQDDTVPYPCGDESNRGAPGRLPVEQGPAPCRGKGQMPDLQDPLPPGGAPTWGREAISQGGGGCVLGFAVLPGVLGGGRLARDMLVHVGRMFRLEGANRDLGGRWWAMSATSRGWPGAGRDWWVRCSSKSIGSRDLGGGSGTCGGDDRVCRSQVARRRDCGGSGRDRGRADGGAAINGRSWLPCGRSAEGSRFPGHQGAVIRVRLDHAGRNWSQTWKRPGSGKWWAMAPLSICR